jgi:hypothetical protein
MASDGTMYAMGRMAMYRYENGDPASREFISDFGPTGASSIALTPDESAVLVSSNNGIYQVSPETGSWTTLGAIATAEDYLIGRGIAVYVPEPSSLAMVMIGAIFARYRTRLRRSP